MKPSPRQKLKESSSANRSFSSANLLWLTEQISQILGVYQIATATHCKPFHPRTSVPSSNLINKNQESNVWHPLALPVCFGMLRCGRPVKLPGSLAWLLHSPWLHKKTTRNSFIRIKMIQVKQHQKRESCTLVSLRDFQHLAPANKIVTSCRVTFYIHWFVPSSSHLLHNATLGTAGLFGLLPLAVADWCRGTENSTEQNWSISFKFSKLQINQATQKSKNNPYMQTFKG